MSFPGVIHRPLEENEFSIYLDNEIPIPISVLGSFLVEIDKEARHVEGMRDLVLQLSDFALGSNELRFRIVGPGRHQLKYSATEERSLAAAERSAKYTMVGAIGTVVSSVASVAAIAISMGNANPASYRITKDYNVQNIYVRAPKEPPHVITREQIYSGRRLRLREKKGAISKAIAVERQALVSAFHAGDQINIAGRLQRRDGSYAFKTMSGNTLSIKGRIPASLVGVPVAIRADVVQADDGMGISVSQVIAELSDF